LRGRPTRNHDAPNGHPDTTNNKGCRPTYRNRPHRPTFGTIYPVTAALSMRPASSRQLVAGAVGVGSATLNRIGGNGCRSDDELGERDGEPTGVCCLPPPPPKILNVSREKDGRQHPRKTPGRVRFNATARVPAAGIGSANRFATRASPPVSVRQQRLCVSSWLVDAAHKAAV
jgi:hypothetical protein